MGLELKLFENEDDKTIFKYAALFGILFSFFSVGWLRFSASIIYFLLASLILNLFYALVLYLLLRIVDSKVKNMKKDLVAMYFLVTFAVSNTIILSVLNESFDFFSVGLLPLILTFAVPSVYKTKKSS